MRLRMFVECRKVVIAKENRHGSRNKLGLEEIKSKLAQLSCIINVDKLLDGLNIVHSLFFVKRKCASSEDTLLQFFLLELQQLYIFVVLSYTHKRCVGFCDWIGNPAMYQWNTKGTVKSDVIRFIKTTSTVLWLLVRFSKRRKEEGMSLTRVRRGLTFMPV